MLAMRTTVFAGLKDPKAGTTLIHSCPQVFPPFEQKPDKEIRLLLLAFWEVFPKIFPNAIADGYIAIKYQRLSEFLHLHNDGITLEDS